MYLSLDSRQKEVKSNLPNAKNLDLDLDTPTEPLRNLDRSHLSPEAIDLLDVYKKLKNIRKSRSNSQHFEGNSHISASPEGQKAYKSERSN